MTNYLCFPCRIHLVNSLQFTNNKLLYQNVQAKPLIKGHPIIDNRNINLSFIF